MPRRSWRRVLRFVAAIALAVISSACSDPCANVAAELPAPDPTPCDAGVLPSCSSGSYCVTDAGLTRCAFRKAAGAVCESGNECYWGTCQSDHRCAPPPGCQL